MTSGLKPADQKIVILLLDLYSIHADLQLEILALRYYEIFHDASMLPLWPFNSLSGPAHGGFPVVFLSFFQFRKRCTRVKVQG